MLQIEAGDPDHSWAEPKDLNGNIINANSNKYVVCATGAAGTATGANGGFKLFDKDLNKFITKVIFSSPFTAEWPNKLKFEKMDDDWILQPSPYDPWWGPLGRITIKIVYIGN